jgi:hypothetical protein
MKKTSRFFLLWPLLLCALSFSYAFVIQEDVSIHSFLELAGISDLETQEECDPVDALFHSPTLDDDRIFAIEILEIGEEELETGRENWFPIETSEYFRSYVITALLLLAMGIFIQRIATSDRYLSIGFEEPCILYQAFRV